MIVVHEDNNSQERLFLFCKYRSSFFCLQDARHGVSDSRV
jgi:hypothetical protein